MAVSHSGKVAVVTGASSGMGKGLARMFAEEGYNVVCAARSEETLTAVVADIAAAGLPQAYAVKTDVTQQADCANLIEKAEAIGPVHILMNCAGVMYFTLMKNSKKDQWAQTIDVNCKGLVHCVGEVLPHMRARKSGHIINISSDASRMLFPALTVYCASKAFIQMFSKGLRAECVGSGIRVTDIQPGDVKTNLIMNNDDEEAAKKVGVLIGKEVGIEAPREQCWTLRIS
jgi:NADP-dependent 3-hydroxy acid dehydrogenase YdfG